jgi:hypothetical protein
MEIIYNKIVGKTRGVLSKDKRNWIWKSGNKKCSEEYVLKSQASYFQSFESLLINIFEKRFREHVIEFNPKALRIALTRAMKDVRKIGADLDKVTWDKIKRGDYCPKCGSKKE